MERSRRIGAKLARHVLVRQIGNLGCQPLKRGGVRPQRGSQHAAVQLRRKLGDPAYIDTVRGVGDRWSQWREVVPSATSRAA